MDDGDAYSKADREEHARRRAEIDAQHQARVRAIQRTMGLVWDEIGPPPPPPGPPRNAKPAKRPVNEEAPSYPYGKKRLWVYFVDSGRWLEATEMGFNNAIRRGLPVRRSKGKPRFAPEIVKEPVPLPDPEHLPLADPIPNPYPEPEPDPLQEQ